MVRLALRAAPLFAAAVTVTEPLPVPPAGLTVTHPAGELDVQAQDCVLALMETFTMPPACE